MGLLDNHINEKEMNIYMYWPLEEGHGPESLPITLIEITTNNQSECRLQRNHIVT